MDTTFIEQSFPLSPIQEGMLFNSLYAPESGVDVIVATLDLREDLDQPVFSRAWQQLVDSHPALRMCFRWQGLEQPCQDVYRGVSQPARHEDFSGLAEHEQEQRWRALVVRERGTAFDMARPPLTRLVTVRFGPRHHRILWLYHHAAFDGVGMTLVLSQAFAAYRALQHGEAFAVPACAAQQAYIEWLQRQDVGASEVFWRGHLAGIDAPTRLGVDRGEHEDPRRVETCPSQDRWLSESATKALGDWARARGLSLNIVLQGVWAVLVSRYSGERRVVFGVVQSGRRSSIEGADQLVGVVMNTLPTAVDVDPSADLVEWLLARKAHWAALRAHAHTPLALIKEWSDIGGRQPLFESLFCFDVLDLTAALRARGDDWEHCEADAFGQPVAPVSLNAYGGRRLLLRINYHELRVEHDAVGRMLGHLETLLAGLVSGVARRVGELPLLTDAERRDALAVRGRSVPLPPDGTVHGLIEAQCARTPQAVAVGFDGGQLTYAELDARARRLAHRLRDLGVGPGSMVGLCVERGLDLPLAMLGILIAGGAYVPLDPAFPAERLSLVLQDTATTILVTQRGLAGSLPSFDGEIVCVDDGWLTAQGAEDGPGPSAAAGPDDLAYVIHTSGSTGRPKGVQIVHRAVVNFLHAMAREPGLAADDVLLAVTTLSFDIAVLELLLPLCVGARVEIASREVAGDGLLLRRKLAECGASVMQATPATWQLLLHAEWRGDGRLKMLCGGEELPRPLAQRLLRRGGELWNMYGPTETTIWSAVARVQPLEGPAASSPHEHPPALGSPIANTSLCVLDEERRLVPRGIPGELYIGGAGLARGYLNQPELTGERFVDSPWPAELPGRLYRTGDRVRRDADGRLAFLGRVDHQVKLRGYRIELGEIESLLRQAPTVAEAAVLLREDAPGDRRLVAYVVPAAGDVCDPDVLLAGLATRLPDYMLPSAFVLLERLPVSPNGKLDRGALPAPKVLPAAAGYRAPEGPTQQALAEVFADLLRAERVGAHDDFFALGGHSLLATRLLSRLRNLFGVELLIREVFDAPSVAALAARVDAARGADRRQASTPIVPRDGEPQLSFAQRRLWLLHQMGSGAAYNMQLVLGISGPLDRVALERALAATLARHAVLRTRYACVDGQPLAVVEPEPSLPLTLVDRSGMAGRERERALRELVVRETETAFDLERAPLLRASLLRLGREEHVLVLVLHHILADAWSLEVLVREIAAHYGASVTGARPDLPPLPVQYSDYAAWQHERLDGEALGTHLEHFRRRLDGASTILDLPTDRPRPAVQTFSGDAQPFALGADLAASLRAAGREHGVTVAMLCLAAFHALLARVSGQRDLVLGMPVANRLRSEVEGLVGMFVNTLALRVDASDDPEFGELLQRVQQACLDGYEHQELPFEKLVEELLPERDLGRTPLFQVLFSMNAARSEPIGSAGVTLRVLPFQLTRVRFDLELHLFEGATDIEGLLAYNTDLFDAETIARWLGHFRRLLEAGVGAPATRISELPLLLESERQTLLGEWGGARVDFPRDVCLHDLFAAQVERTPDALALVGGGEPLSYRALAERARRLAQALASRGVGPGSSVGICLERSNAMIVAVLGVLEAGAAYVPLDPTYPSVRLAAMAETAELSLVIAQAATRERVGAQDAAPALLMLDGDEVAPDGVPPDEVPPDEAGCAAPSAGGRRAVAPDDLAYVLFTSGSTGRPKGVAMPHAPLVNLMHWQFGQSRPGPGSRTLQFAPLGFDVSCQEIFATLGSGGTLCLIDDEARRDPETLLAFLREHSVTRVFMPFVALQQMIEVAVAHDLLPTGLREVITAGEQLQVGAALVGFFERLDDCSLVNQYGPTECHVVTSQTLQGPPASWPRLPLIGRPIANVRTYVLDARMQLCPLGVVGELFLGGAAVSRGYLGDEALTADRFVPDPFSTDPRGRLYRSGDLARFRSDGALEFLGRSDTQVKLRGFRVELGEVEAVLLDHSGVQQAALIVREDQPGDRRLVAYVVGEEREAPAPAALRAFLQERLPVYMLPAAFVTLPALPLTPSGKLDRKALPLPEGRQSGREYVAPRSPTEVTLAGIWSGLLGVSQVGVHDDFFEIGGHSLLAMQVTSRIRDAFGAALKLQTLFESPTVAGLAAAVDAQAGCVPLADADAAAAAAADAAEAAAADDDDDEVIDL